MKRINEKERSVFKESDIHSNEIFPECEIKALITLFMERITYQDTFFSMRSKHQGIKTKSMSKEKYTQRPEEESRE